MLAFPRSRRCGEMGHGAMRQVHPPRRGTMRRPSGGGRRSAARQHRPVFLARERRLKRGMPASSPHALEGRQMRVRQDARGPRM